MLFKIQIYFWKLLQTKSWKNGNAVHLGQLERKGKLQNVRDKYKCNLSNQFSLITKNELSVFEFLQINILSI